MKCFVTLILFGGVVLMPAHALADAGDDTLRFYLERSDLVVTGKITTEPLAFLGEEGVPNYICKFEIDAVLKGQRMLKGASINVNIMRFEADEKDRNPLIAENSECILFLKKQSHSTVPAWVTADFWFGVQHPSPWMAKSLKRLSREEQPADFQDIEFRGGIAYMDARPFTGTAEERYPSGAIKGSYHFLSGKNVGKRTTYHENGQKHFECEFKEGKPHGVEYLWDEEGNLVRVGSQSHGKGHGAYSWWDKEGKLLFVRIMRDGHTIREIHYSGPDVVADGEYRDKRPWNGTFRDWHWKNGNEVFYHEIKNGQPWQGLFWMLRSGKWHLPPAEDKDGWKRVRYQNGDPLADGLQP